MDRADPRPYWDYIGEAVEPWSYLKSTYYKPLGYPDGLYRVGPLARLNVVDQLGTPAADAELAEYRARLGRYPSSSFQYHWARLIEIVHCIDTLEDLCPTLVSSAPMCEPVRPSTAKKASGCRRPPGAPCSTTTAWTVTGLSNGSTSL